MVVVVVVVVVVALLWWLVVRMVRFASPLLLRMFAWMVLVSFLSRWLLSIGLRFSLPSSWFFFASACIIAWVRVAGLLFLLLFAWACIIAWEGMTGLWTEVVEPEALEAEAMSLTTMEPIDGSEKGSPDGFADGSA